MLLITGFTISDAPFESVAERYPPSTWSVAAERALRPFALHAGA